MSGLPAVTGREAVRALQRAGFSVVRITGSHHRLVHGTDPARSTTIAVHGSKSLKRGTLRNIIKQAGLTVDEFVALL